MNRNLEYLARSVVGYRTTESRTHDDLQTKIHDLETIGEGEAAGKRSAS